MSTPTFASKPAPETRTLLVGGPFFFDRVIDGVAVHALENKRHATREKIQKARTAGKLRADGVMSNTSVEEQNYSLRQKAQPVNLRYQAISLKSPSKTR